MSHHGNAIPFLLLNPQTTFVIYTFIFMHKPPLLLNVLQIHAFVGLPHKLNTPILLLILLHITCV